MDHVRPTSQDAPPGKGSRFSPSPFSGRTRWPFLLMVFLGVAFTSDSARSRESVEVPLVQQALDSRTQPTEFERRDVPAAEPPALSYRAADTLSFGYVDGDGFAVLGDIWSFDHGSPDPLEGWYSADVTAQSAAYWRHIDAATWNADPEHTVAPPVLRGDGSAWVGAFGTESLDLCWEGGLGYGNIWCQRLVSPLFEHDGTTPVDINWVHFNDTEEDFDYTLIYLEPGTGLRTELRRYTDLVGTDPDHPNVPPPGTADGETLSAADFDGNSEFRIVFEMTSDGGWADSDGLYTTEYGPAAFDDVALSGIGPDGAASVLFEFETDLEGWTAEPCAGAGSFLGVAPLASYSIEEALYCSISGNVMGLHNEDLEHEYGQHELAVSPRVDVLSDVTPYFSGEDGIPTVLAEWSQYSIMPQANGVFYRPGWMYYPSICELTGNDGWTDRVGQNTFFFVGEDPVCSENVDNGSVTDVPIPPDAEQLRFVYEVYASCDAFSIVRDICTDTTNFSPLIDNVQIRFTLQPDAPVVRFDNGLRYQDGFSQGTILNLPYQPGNADVTRNRNFGNTPPIVLGDSLYVSGPRPNTDPATQWESKLWFRVPRVGPSADARYADWRDRVADGRNIDPLLAGGGPVEFTFAFMDSFQIGTNRANNKFVSYFREDDDDFDSGSGDLSEENEIIADGVLFPGTQVEYFVSSNYIGNPQSFLLPDTAGGNWLEFEILPSWRDDGGVLKYPCTLYIDAANDGEQFIVGSALDELGIVHDRYDYADPLSSWKSPMARHPSSGSNNGCTLYQLLGYKAILVGTGTTKGFPHMWPDDFGLFHDWLTASVCSGLSSGQLMVLNGNGVSRTMQSIGSALLTYAGASHLDDSYREFSGDESYCVQLEAPSSSSELFDTSHSLGDYDIDAFGSGFPTDFDFDVMAPIGAGVGNRVYKDVDLGVETGYSQIAIEAGTSGRNHVIVDGVSWSSRSMRDPVEECTSDLQSTIDATTNELRAIFEWAFGAGFAELDDLCQDSCTSSDVDDDGVLVGRAVTGLQSSSPNPFNPRTQLRFSLATEGEARLDIYDASGRRVRTLLDGVQGAGAHQVTWDGTDEDGQSLPSGVYWARFQTGDFEGSSKLIRIQ